MKLKILISVFFVSFNCFAQNAVNDCSGAIQICGNGSISSNADGVGKQEINNLNSCSSEEHNSLWLKIDITKSGTLGFDLIPTSTDIQIDYDFFIYGPNASCNNLGFAIRCSTTNPNAAGTANNHTGMNDTETDTSEGPGVNGNNYVKSIDVQAGDSYFIVIDRPIGNSPFNLEWTGTSTQGGFPFPNGPEVNTPQNLETCNANGIANFDLSVTKNEITTENKISLTYHNSYADAIDNNNSIHGIYTSSAPIKTIFARVENDFTGCAEIVDFDLIIHPGPAIRPELKYAKCDLDYSGYEVYELPDVLPEILNGLDPSGYESAFFNSLQDAESNVNAIALSQQSSGGTVYARIWENGEQDCYNISEINLILNIPPQISSYSVLQPVVNANNNSVTLDLENTGNYEFAIGNIGGPYQENTTFKNIPSGFQLVYIRDKKGCAIISTEIAVLGYDNYFTPNNDGIHDYWQLKGIAESIGSDNHIYIFDRYGKLLKTLQPMDKGWDGIFNGKEMPADDYWFRVYLQNGQEFNGNFTLKR